VLGTADRLDTGLAEFHALFGAQVVALEDVDVYVGGAFGRRLATAARLVRHDRTRLLSIATGRVSRWYVYRQEAATVASPVLPPGTLFHKLSDRELETLMPTRDLQREQLQRRAALGGNTAYAIFCGGRLAHISWLITYDTERRLRPRVLGLRPDEAEITACYTLPEFRGQGLYPIAIRALCQIARGMGISRIFMKTVPDNTPSQQGILKAGLDRAGHILQLVLPFRPDGQGVIIRRIRR
jgi:RimJ/RimL family protein N-acetyltransferase